jgi:hypothetical protein
LARSEVGVFFLNRQGPERPTNRSYGVDAVMRPRNDLQFNMLYSGTDTPGLKGEDHVARIEAEYDREHLRLFAVHLDAGNDYRNDLGFIKQPGVKVSRMEITPRIRPGRDGFIREWGPAFNLRYMTDQTGLLLLRKQTSDLNVYMRDGGVLRLSHRRYFDRLLTDFRIRPNVIVPAGDHNYAEWTLFGSSDQSRMFSGNATWTVGNFWDGEKTTVSFGARYRPNARLGAEVSLARDDVDLPGGAFTALVTRLRLGYALSTTAFLDAFIQYNNQDRRVATNVRFNIIHRPLSDIFVVFNEDRPTFDGALPNRALSLKYTHLIAF